MDVRSIVFLHGFLGSALDFQPIANRLSSSIESICLDLPGHGRSIALPAETYRFVGAAKFVLKNVASLSRPFPRPALYGYSMGGRLALYLALHHPDRFSHVFIESASPGLDLELDRVDRQLRDAKLAAHLQADFPAFLDSWYRTELFQTLRHHPSFPEIFNRRRNNHPIELARALQGMSIASQPSLWDQLKTATVPIDLIVGTQDPKFLALNQKMSRLCPTSTLNPIAGVGHNVHAEHPASIDRLIKLRLS